MFKLELSRVYKISWPSGLRRRIKAPVRKGASSNLVDIIVISFFCTHDKIFANDSFCYCYNHDYQSIVFFCVFVSLSSSLKNRGFYSSSSSLRSSITSGCSLLLSSSLSSPNLRTSSSSLRCFFSSFSFFKRFNCASQRFAKPSFSASSCSINRSMLCR